MDIWTPKEAERFCCLYPSAFVEELGQLFPNRSHKKLRSRASRLRITKVGRVVRFPVRYSDVADGNYVSGLVDGEGSFGASVKYREDRDRWNFSPRFTLGLRIDDKPILEWLKKYFGCGGIDDDWQAASPRSLFRICGLYDIMSRVLPHFDAFPLRAKKKADYMTWQRMVLLQARHYDKPWSDKVRAEMQLLYRKLKADRRLQEAP